MLEQRHERLQADGYKVTAVQLPETSLADDVARVRHVLTRQSGPTVLAAHCYGGQVITSLGTDEVIPPGREAVRTADGRQHDRVASGHCAMVSHPEQAHERIVTAAKAAAVPG